MAIVVMPLLKAVTKLSGFDVRYGLKFTPVSGERFRLARSPVKALAS